tara:strand:- start:69 stop:248 length:180 start_codon:yes stop_codon:yes gene_type:complete
MAVPKRKVSRSRRGKRRSHISYKIPNVVTDKKSGSSKLSHHIDPETGKYKGIEFFKPKN